MEKFNVAPITAVTKSLCTAQNIAPPEYARSSVKELDEFVYEATSGAGVDRIVVYNPDAIGEWIADKYRELLPNMFSSDIVVPMLSVFPPKTPVCFGSMYTGAEPSEHGIQKYEKVKIEIDSYFDALVRAGKRAAIVTVIGQSMDVLYRGRKIDYFALKDDFAVVDKTLELIKGGEYDVIIAYNQAYDDALHRTSPKSIFARRALKQYNESYGRILSAIREYYRGTITLAAALTDHGSHRSRYLLGTHGANIAKDMNITHFYSIIDSKPRE